MNQITVGLGERSYPIWIGERILANIGSALDAVAFPVKVAVVTNPTVGDLYCDQLVESLAASGRKVSVIRVPDGEEYKTLETLENIYDVLIDRQFDRYCGLIALGGGVIGDMAGFAAATFLRGIPFVQIPTTLLSQVDSSVGGKTGVNHPQGKNLIGAFYQPRHVHIDVMALATLSKREFASGLAEVVKYGIIHDLEFFNWLEEHRESLVARSADALVHAVMKSCQIKANVVENDEKEQGIRVLLNLGHTFGHAVETLAGYGVVKHGEAVAIGMVLAARISQRINLCSAADVDRIVELLTYFDLPVTPPDFAVTDYLKVMQRDKKVKDGVVRVVLNHGIGSAAMHQIKDLDKMLGDLLT
ncbi:MAG: 3-dehydroquinate synthase [Desulfuromonadales bacterium]|nr:3-dehydroquinate synthase [Desulfuromonadales bacterium]